MNNLRVVVYSTGTTPINDPMGELELIEGLNFSKGYPGGLYLNASMNVPRDIAQSWFVKGAQRLVIMNGLEMVWEGKIADLRRALQRASQGVEIEAVGYWGALLATRRLQRLYADARTDEQTWMWSTPVDYQAEQTNVIRYDEDQGENMLRFVPQGGVTWAANDTARLTYLAPTGETIRRIDYDYDFLEASGQTWKMRLRDEANATDLFVIDATGSNTGQNVEPAAGCNELSFEIVSLAGSQTVPTASLDLYAEMRNITVYATMNHTPAGGKNVVNLYEIARDLRAELTDLSSNETLIGSNTLDLRPIIADGFPTIGDILQEAASYGDSSQNRWAVGIRGSHLSTDSKPILFAEQYPVLTDYDYAVRVEESNLAPNFDISEGYIGSDENNVWNWIVVQYRDERGFNQWVTPDDNANLKDTTSISDWGQRDYLIRIGHADQSVAVNIGRRFLEAHKDPYWHMARSIKIEGHIRKKSGDLLPASQIQAGKRLRIENFLQDPALDADDLIFLITKTNYRDDKETCEITTGRPNSLDIYLAQQDLELHRLGRT